MEMVDHVDEGNFVDLDAAVVANETQDRHVPAVIKMKLNTFLKTDNALLKTKLNEVVIDGNQLLGEAYAFSNYHICRLFKEGCAIPQVDRNFYYRCLLAVGSSMCKADTLGDDFKTSIQGFDSLRPEPDHVSEPVSNSSTPSDSKTYNCNPLNKQKVVSKSTQLLADLSIQMATMASNHLWMNLSSRIAQYLGWRYPELRRFHKAIVRALVFLPKDPVQKIMNEAALFKKEKKKKDVPAKPEPSSTDGAPAKRRRQPKVKDKSAAELAKEVRDAKRRDDEGVVKDRAVQVATSLRGIMQLPSSQQFASRAHLTLPLYNFLLKETIEGRAAHDVHLQSLPEGTRKRRFAGRLFDLLPTKNGFTTSYIPISSMFLASILKNAELEEFAHDGRDLNARTAFWDKYFDTREVETRNMIFGNRIMTDGYAVSVLVSCRVRIDSGRGKKDVSVEAMREIVESATPGTSIRFCGVDPGFTDVVTAAFDDRTSKSYSSARYYEKAKINHSRRKTTKMNEKTKDDTDRLRVSGGSRTTDLDKMSEYLRSYLGMFRRLLVDRHNQDYRKYRFLRYIHKQHAVREIVDMLVGKEGTGVLTLVGFGDWSGGNKSPISRKHSGPIQKIKEEIGKRKNAAIKPVDEFRSSQLDSNTHVRLVNMKAKTVKRQKDGTMKTSENVKVHKVLHCKPSDKGSRTGFLETTWNRDVNASRNILMLFRCEMDGALRPVAFQRSSAMIGSRQPVAEGPSKDESDEARSVILPTHLLENRAIVRCNATEGDYDDRFNNAKVSTA